MDHFESFSERNGYINEVDITIYDDAPLNFRYALVNLAYDCGFHPSLLRELVCKQLGERPNPSNSTPYPYVDEEVRKLIDECPWFEVYDILEKIAGEVKKFPSQNTTNYKNRSQQFDCEINKIFTKQGIGFKLVDGKISHKSSEGNEKIFLNAIDAAAAHPSTVNELKKAMDDISKRPADLTGAIHHAMLSLECLARDVSGSKEGLGDWIKNHREAFPKPIGSAVEKIWGYASNHGRHLQPSGEPFMDEAELVVYLSATLVNYLSKKGKSHPDFQKNKRTEDSDIWQ